MALRCCFIFFLVVCTNVFADEQMRQVQEELRKRNLYFGDIDGQPHPELTSALRRYQAKKGFAITGTIDSETATSLNVQLTSAPAEPVWPDVPVLRSDRARELPPQRRAALEQQGEQNPDAAPSPPAEAPESSSNITAERIRSLVQQYLRDSEGPDIPAQTKYFAYPVEYFDHGAVDAGFVNRDVTNYVKRWPERKYVLQDPIDVAAASREGETVVKFPITFEVRNKNHEVTGRTMNFWTLKSDGGDFKIVAIREQRLRD